MTTPSPRALSTHIRYGAPAIASLVLALLVSVLIIVTPASAQGGDDSADEECSDDASTGKGKKSDDDCEEEPPPPPQVSLTNVPSPPPAGIDIELEAALDNVGFLDTWHVRTPTHPRLSLVAVSSPRADAQRQVLLDTTADLVNTRETTTALVNATQENVNRRRLVERKIEDIDAELATLANRRGAAIEVLGQLDADLEQVLGVLREAAVGMYVNDEQLTVSGIDDVETYNQQQELVVRVDATIDELLARRDDLQLRIEAQILRIGDIDATIATRQGERAELEGQYADLTTTIEALNEQVTALTMHRIELENSLPGIITDTHVSRMGATAPGINVSMVALDSYVRAAENVVGFYPSCAIRWELLAGIATIESGHGTFGGSVVGPTGDTSRRIFGPVLDGTLEDTAVIDDSDGGRLDGNGEYDRAVGPFQFLPSTWRSFGLDGNRDGIANPHNMYDGALSAGGYLCTRSNLANDPQIARSVLTYNQSAVYLANVTGAARSYITSLQLPEATYDPDELVEKDGWRVGGEEPPVFEEIGKIGRDPNVAPTTPEPVEALEPTGD